MQKIGQILMVGRTQRACCVGGSGIVQCVNSGDLGCYVADTMTLGPKKRIQLGLPVF